MNTFRSPESTKARATELLQALGNTADQVAEKLLAGGHLGAMQNCGACPIATYLMRSDLGLYGLSVLGRIIIMALGPDEGDTEYVRVPAAVEQFIDGFDEGQFPQLVKPAVTA